MFPRNFATYAESNKLKPTTTQSQQHSLKQEIVTTNHLRRENHIQRLYTIISSVNIPLPAIKRCPHKKSELIFHVKLILLSQYSRQTVRGIH